LIPRRDLGTRPTILALAGVVLAALAVSACSPQAATPPVVRSVTSGHAATSAATAPTGSSLTSGAPTSAPVPAKPSSAATSSASTDATWTARYRGLLVRGFRPSPGYKAVALTFDDGPNHETKYIIETLRRYGGRATFFDTGKNLLKNGNGRQAIMISQAGFELGDHTQDHMPGLVSSVWHKTYAEDVFQITNPDKIIARYVPFKTLWLRPPGGSIDRTGVKAAAATGHLVINYTIDSNDSHGGPRTPGYIYNICTKNVRSGDVILLHVTHPDSMAALPKICARLTAEGFQLVTVSELARHSTPISERIPR
jgi:peptidoglycan/xylan/chitin deacetylase (PgdA/CDA1 family)